MAGGFSAGGLITGLDTNNIIRQLIQLERQPIRRIESRVESLKTQQTSIRELRTELLSLRNLLKDFQLGSKFGQFSTPSSNESVLTAAASSSNPTVGSFQVDVLQLASATVATSSSRIGAAIDPNAALNSSGLTTQVQGGTFSINGVQINVDPTTDSLNDVLSAINGSGAGVTATYDGTTDTVVFENATAGDTSFINFGATGDTSNFLSAISVEGAVQSTGGSGSTTVSSSRPLGTVNPGGVLNTENFGGGAVSAGSFRINGVSIAVDPTTDTLNDVLNRINASDAGVTATFDAATDSIRVVADTLGSRTIRFESGTSNFLDVTNLTSATQTAGQDAQFTVNGGAVQTSNTNEVTTAIGGVTLNFQSTGSSTVTVGPDDEGIIETVQEFVDTFNASVKALAERLAEDGDLENDNSIRQIESFLRSNVFTRVPGLSGDFESLLDIGVSSGEAFDSSAIFQLQIDTEELREAIVNDRSGVESLFTNDDGTGVVDTLFGFIDAATESTGYLNERARAGGSIDTQIETLNGRIDNLERVVALREERLRAQFARLETLTNSFQTQGASLAGLAGQFGAF